MIKEIISKIYRQHEFPPPDDGGFYTNGECFFLKHFLKPHDIVFDVGANEGDWSKLALDIEPTIKLTCFEPVPAIFNRMKELIKPFSNQCYNIALSNRTGKQKYFYGDTDHFGGSSYYYYHGTFHQVECKTMDVELDTLDQFCENHKVDKIDYLKIDTEGSEFDVLRGAKNILFSHKVKALQFEYNETWRVPNFYLRDVIKFLTEADYTIFRIFSKGLIHITHWEGCLENMHYANYFAILSSDLPEYTKVRI